MAVEKLNFLSNAGGCEPEDDKGRLTECFLQNLEAPVTARDLYETAFDANREQFKKDIRWIVQLCKETANKGEFQLFLPQKREFEDIIEGASYVIEWESLGAKVSTSTVGLRATKLNTYLGTDHLTKHHVRLFEESGFKVNFNQSPFYINSISWDK